MVFGEIRSHIAAIKWYKFPFFNILFLFFSLDAEDNVSRAPDIEEFKEKNKKKKHNFLTAL